MAFPPRLAIASKNPHKLRELAAICADWPVEWVTFDTHEGEWPDVDEPHDTYVRNAFEKACAVAQALEIPAVADDSGLEVDALGGAPGPRSARYAGEDATDGQPPPAPRGEGPAGGRPGRDTGASRRRLARRAELRPGVCEGVLVEVPRGAGGFGYDPVFVPQGSSRAMAELADEEKDAISHRGRAFRALRAVLAAE
jgi:XTP/dITP diphosphohydrolase